MFSRFFSFFTQTIKTLEWALKNMEGRVTGNTGVLFFGLTVYMYYRHILGQCIISLTIHYLIYSRPKIWVSSNSDPFLLAVPATSLSPLNQPTPWFQDLEYSYWKVELNTIVHERDMKGNFVEIKLRTTAGMCQDSAEETNRMQMHSESPNTPTYQI